MRIVDQPTEGEQYLTLHPSSILAIHQSAEWLEQFDRIFPDVAVIPTDSSVTADEIIAMCATDA